MAVIEHIERVLQGNIEKGVPTFSGTPIAGDRYRNLVGGFLDAGRFQIDSARLETEPDAVMIAGQGSVPGLDSFQVKAGYCVISTRCYFQFEAQLPKIAAFSAFQSIQTPIEGVTAIWSYGPLEWEESTDLTPACSHLLFRASIRLAGLEIPVEVRPPAHGHETWDLSGDFAEIPLPSLDPVLQWLARSASLPPLPAGIGALDSLAIAGLAMSFHPESGRVESAHLALTTSSPWTLVANQIVIDDPLLSLGFVRSGTSEQLTVHVEIAGELRLGGQTVSMRVAHDPSGVTLLEIRGDDFRLPGLTALSSLLGEPRLAAAFPESLRSIENFLLREFTLELDANTMRVTLARIAIGCESPIALAQNVILENTDLRFEVIPGADHPVTGQVAALLGLAEHFIPLHASLEQDLDISASIPELPLADLSAVLPGLPSELPQVTLSNIELQLSTAGSLSFQAAAGLDFQELAKALNVPLPGGTAKLSLSSLTLEADAKEGAWRVTAKSEQRCRFPETGAVCVEMKEIEISFGCPRTKQFSVGCRFVLDGTVEPAENFRLSLKQLEGKFETGGPWSFTGHVDAVVFGKAFTNWSAAIDQSVFAVSCPETIQVFDWTYAGAASIRELTLFVSREGEEANPRWGFGVKGEARLLAGNGAIDVRGDVEVDTVRKLLRLSSRNPVIPPVPLVPDVPGTPTLHLEIAELRAELDAGNWRFGGEVQASIHDLPSVIRGYLPADQLHGKLDVRQDGLRLSLEVEDGRVDFGSLAIKIGGKEIDLGTPGVELTEVGVVLGDRRALEGHFRVVVPRQLNGILGWDEHGQARNIFLNDAFDLVLSVGGALTLALDHGTSPFKALQFELREDGTTWSHWDLRPFGEFNFQTPILEFKNGSWGLSVGMEHGPLQFPLTFLKQILEYLKMPGVQFIPDGIPIKDIDIARLGEELPGIVGAEVWNAVIADEHLRKLLQDFMDQVSHVFSTVREKMPRDFVEYLTIHVPKTIYFNFEIAPGRGPRFGLSTKDEEPIRFLMPWLAAFPPEFVGFSVREISIGQAFGSLGILEIDGRVDRFDFLTLIVAALPKVKGQGFRNRFTFARTLAVFPFGFPVPIPLVYDELSWELKSWIGLGITSRWHMKEKDDLAALLTDLIRFVTERDYFLHLDKQSKAFELDFTIGPNFLALPDYLGGSVIGPQQDSPTLDLAYAIKCVLDGLKDGNATFLIQAIPLWHPRTGAPIRIGASDVVFGPLSFGAGWCIVTEEEFVKEIAGNAKAETILGKLDVDAVLKTTRKAAGGAVYKKGFIVVLAGNAALGPVFDYHVHFGMALTAAGGFETGFRMQATIGTVLQLSVGGGIAASQEKTAVRGDCSLMLGATELIGVETVIAVEYGKSLTLDVRMRLAGEDCVLEGELYIGSDEVRITGGFAWRYAGGQTAKEQVAARFGLDGIQIEVGASSIYGTACTLGVLVNAADGSIWATASFDVSGVQKAFAGSFEKLADDVAQEARNEYTKWQAALDGYKGNANLIQGLAALLKSLAGRLPQMVGRIVEKECDKRSVPGLVRSPIRKRASKEADDYADKLKRFAASLSKAEAETAKKMILGLLDEVLKARIAVQILTSKWTYDPLTKDQRRQIEDARALVQSLPARKLAEAKAREVYGSVKGRADIAGEIAEGVRKGVIGAVPDIRYIRFQTQLVLKSPKGQIAVGITHSGKESELRVDADLGNLIEAAPGIAAQLVSALV